MKLSDLIDYRNNLKTVSAMSVAAKSDIEIAKITNLVETQNFQLENFAEVLKAKQLNLQKSFHNYEIELDKFKIKLDQLIASNEPQWFANSYRLYEEEVVYEKTEYILQRRIELSKESENFLISRVQLYGDWKAPGMIIRPGPDPFIEHLVSLDPLYVLDKNYDLLAPAVSRFNPVYQNRIRQYIIRELVDPEFLIKIPDNQFGVCLVYNYFNFRPLEIIKRYLTEIQKKLRPGGVLLMTFNDCDRGAAVRLVERNSGAYTPGYLVKDLAKSLGFEPLFSWNDNGAMTWLELRKPGKFESLKGGQTLAKVVAKPK